MACDRLANAGKNLPSKEQRSLANELAEEAAPMAGVTGGTR